MVVPQDHPVMVGFPYEDDDGCLALGGTSSFTLGFIMVDIYIYILYIYIYSIISLVSKSPIGEFSTEIMDYTSHGGFQAIGVPPVLIHLWNVPGFSMK